MGNLCSCGHTESDRSSSRRPVRRHAANNAAATAHASADDLVDDDFPYQNQLTLSSLFPYLESNNVRWDAEYSTWSYSMLKKKRAEFWDTRVGGNAEMWGALRSSVEMINQLDERVKNGEALPATERGEQLATCDAILESASLTKFSFSNSEKKDTVHCYDRLGVKYDIPFFVFVLPKNLLKDDSESEKTTQAEKEGNDNVDEKKRTTENPASMHASSTQLHGNEVSSAEVSSLPSSTNTPAATSRGSEKGDDGKDKNHRDPNMVKLKFRFSNGTADCSSYFHIRSSIGQLKKFIDQEKKIAVDRQIVFYQGRRYADHEILANCPFKSGTILQLMIKG